MSLVTLLSVLALSVSAVEYTVYPEGERCPAPPCLSLEQYLKNVSHYFQDNSSFHFLPGDHYLNSSLDLENLENVTLSGIVGRTKLWMSDIFKCENLQGITISGLDIWNGNFISFSSDVLIINTQFNQISDVGWHSSNGYLYNCTFWNSGIVIKNSAAVFYNAIFYGQVVVGISSNSSNIELRDNFHVSGATIALYASNSSVALIGNSSLDNTEGAIRLSHSQLIVTGQLLLENNTGDNGAGLYLEKSSSVKLKAPVKILFISNYAHMFGAAIYIDDSKLSFFRLCENNVTENYYCFFEIESNSSNLTDVHLEFLNNTAVMAGSALYGGGLTQCHIKINNISQKTKGYNVFRQISTLSNNETVSSKSLYLCFCSNGVDLGCSTIVDVDVIPGKSFNLSLAAMGQVNTTTADIVVNSNGFRVVITSIPKLIVGCNVVTFQVFSNLGVSAARASVFPYECSSGDVKISLNIHSCPKGFMLGNDICMCEKTLQTFSDVDCNIQTGLIENSGSYWISPSIENGTYKGVKWAQYCPNGYCKKPTKAHPIQIDFSSPNGSNSQCASNRNGILCGACVTGYSLSLNTLECKDCNNEFTSLIILFLAAGVGLIVLLLGLHMTVASGTLNGLILYVNIVNVHRDVFFPRDTDSSDVKPLQVFISWLNLDFGIPLCFYDGLNAYQYYWLQYAFPLYLWFLTGIIIFSSKYWHPMRRLLGSNPVAVLATVILMSYNKCLQASVEALAFANLQTSEEHNSKVWLYDGNLAYFEDWRHIVLAAGAICFLIFFILPFAFFLVFGYTLQAYSDRKWFQWFNRFTPLLDAYYAPFSKNTRYWPGLMLVLRIVLFMSYMISSDNLMVIVCAIFTATIALQWKVFKIFYLNVLQASFALNLCVLCVGTYHVQQYHGNQSVLSNICAGVALLEFVGILVFHVHIRLKCKKVISKMPFLSKIQRYRLHDSVTKREIEPLLEDTNSIDFREPLLSTKNSIILN